MIDLVLRAAKFAEKAHAGQTRKYTGEPYISHPRDVAWMVYAATSDDEATAAAWLHDVVEDCGVDPREIAALFGMRVAQLVEMVTDVSRPEDGNRRARKAIDRDHLARADATGQTIKLADLIDNTTSIVERDPDFAKVYLREKRELLEVLTKGDRMLWERAAAVCGATDTPPSSPR
jgi:(p)ppGpp synthase/HD superfamily hydrolase